MKTREKIFLIEFLLFIFLALGIIGNNDLQMQNTVLSWTSLIITGVLTFLQMKYIENFER